jgi:SecD/SecF fusion protein
MPTNYSGRITLICTVLILSLLAIFWGPPSRLFNSHLTLIQKTDLRPGIDMVGGVSLVYAIQAPNNSDPDLSEHVMEALKKRVDPLGLRNLVWRPQGANRIEIEMPLSPEAAEAPAIKASFSAAEKDLYQKMIRQDDVVNAVEHMTGSQRAQVLAGLAADSKTRTNLFKNLSDTYDKIQKLRANPDKLPLPLLATRLQPLIAVYDDLKQQIEQTNLVPTNLESILDQVYSDDPDQKKAGQSKLDDLRKQFADFPSMLKAMDDFEARYKDYNSVKNAITGADDLKQLLQGSGVLEFHILADSVTANPADLKAMDSRLEPGGRGPLPQPGDTIRWMEVDNPDEFARPGQTPETHEWNGKQYMPVLVTPDASMTKASAEKWGLERAQGEQKQDGSEAVGFNFDVTGGNLFGDLTTHWTNIARQRSDESRARLAIVLDNKIISAPNLNEPITGGSGEITGGGAGGFTSKELNYLINTLNAGSLPAQLSDEPISEQQVGPSLGADNLYRGLVACGFGLIVVAVFLISYYYFAGLVAFLAVVMNLVLILGTMCALNATFTLPSIAGIVLTIGTAVDANVLIFERLREEQHKNLPLRMALRNSYAQAQSAIIDSNMTSIITSLCLYAFGSEEVKGFGLTLIIGIVASLFTALYVTKTVFGIMIDHFGMRELGSLPLTFPKWDRLLRPKWDWMGKAWIFYTFSIIMLSIGMTMFVAKVRAGRMMDIEFATGTSLQFQLKQPTDQDEIRKLIDAESEKNPAALPSPSVVAVGTDRLHYQVVSPNDQREQVRNAVLEAMHGRLQIQLPSDFNGANQEYRDAADKQVLPIAKSTISVGSYTPPDAAAHPGGVLIVLRNISPPLSAQDIQKRMDNQRLSGSASSTGSLYYAVDTPGDPSQPTDFAVVVGWSQEVSYEADQGQWADGLAQPLWGLVKDAVNHPPSFEQETNFDPQVAGEMQRDAFLALTFSIIAIMIYIWVRFGNLKYGTATVIALLHDTVFTLAAIGFAHYIAESWHPNFLQIEPFRINLTVVAGILTIMGYSMIDTIVVFDRIRENRGRYGHLDRNVINDAINQTLSRTILTCGTTIMTVSFMYFLGGAGIHGFTFVLLIGILVGTYSSVAIAAPLLLLGREKQPTGVIRPPMAPPTRATV